ncbi:MOSC domain-containing protein [Nocardioides korecus]
MRPVVQSLRRYPVKSMGGEDLLVAEVDARGVAGDRAFAVVDADGRFASGKDTRRFRRRDAVFDHGARTREDGRVVVVTDGRERVVGDPALDADLSSRMGDPVRVLPEGAVPHQDMGAVSLVGTATLRWCAERWGGTGDVRRLRANVLVATREPFEEEAWVGRTVLLGSVELAVVERVPRCRMVDLDQDGVAVGAPWLRGIGRERGMFLATYADVRRPGAVRVGDEVRLLPG